MTLFWTFLFCLMFCTFKACLGTVVNLNCTFETGFCGWQNRNNSKLSWHIWNSTSPLGRTALPFKDHSLKNNSGHFAFIRGTEARDSSWNASLISKLITMSGQGKMTFWYYMRGHGVGLLQVYFLMSSGSSVSVYQLNGRQGREWKRAEITLIKGKYQIVIAATTLRHYDSDLAIDDITIIEDSTELTTTMKPSTTEKAIHIPISCNFENGMCGFTIPPSSYSPVAWQRTKQKAIENGNAYIKGDNTVGNGYYISLLEHTPGGMAGDKSEMLSPVISTVQPSCLTMAYTLPSSHSGTISIYQKSHYNRTWDLLKEISGYKGQGWKSVKVDIPTSPSFQIVIEGSYAGTKGSFVGIDDLSIKNGKCIQPTMQPVSSSLVTSCNFTSQTEITSLSCTFEDDLCEYQTETEGLKWRQMEGAYGGYFSRINLDHTSQNESYAMLDVDDYSAPFNSGGDLKSIALNNTVCIEFWYQIFGFGGNLEVMMESNNGLRKSIWKSSNQNRKWTMVALRVESMSTFKIVFHSVKLKASGYVAIDDVTGYNVWPDTTTGTITSEMSRVWTTTYKNETNHTAGIINSGTSISGTNPKQNGTGTPSSVVGGISITTKPSNLGSTKSHTTVSNLVLNHTTGIINSGTSISATNPKQNGTGTPSSGHGGISFSTKSSYLGSTKSHITVSKKVLPTFSSTLRTNTKNDNSNQNKSEDKATIIVISVVASLVALTIILVVVYRIYKRYLPFKDNFNTSVELKTVIKTNTYNSISTVNAEKQDSVSNTKFKMTSNVYLGSAT